MSKPGLTPKQQRFVDEYLVDCNATQAALRAGYSSGDVGRQLLTKPHVQAAVSAAQADRAGRVRVGADDVLRELLLVARSDLGEVLDFSGADVRLRPACDIPEHTRRAVSGVKVRRYVEGRGDDAREVEVTEIKLWDKLAALDKLARHLGLLVSRHEHTGPDGGPIRAEVRHDGTPLLTADDVAAARRLVGMAGRDLPEDG